MCANTTLKKQKKKKKKKTEEDEEEEEKIKLVIWRHSHQNYVCSIRNLDVKAKHTVTAMSEMEPIMKSKSATVD